MSATKIEATKRFFQPEISKVIFMTAVADYKAGATRSELDAGKDLTDEIAEISGFNTTSGTIDTPDLGSRFTSKIGGRITVDDSSITFYASQDGKDVRTVLPRGTKGFLAFMDGGDVPTQPYDLMPAEVTNLGKVRATGDNAFQLTVGFAITGVPAEDLDIPAAGA